MGRPHSCTANVLQPPHLVSAEGLAGGLPHSNDSLKMAAHASPQNNSRLSNAPSQSLSSELTGAAPRPLPGTAGGGRMAPAWWAACARRRAPECTAPPPGQGREGRGEEASHNVNELTAAGSAFGWEALPPKQALPAGHRLLRTSGGSGSVSSSSASPAIVCRIVSKKLLALHCRVVGMHAGQGAQLHLGQSEVGRAADLKLLLHACRHCAAWTVAFLRRACGACNVGRHAHLHVRLLHLVLHRGNSRAVTCFVGHMQLVLPADMHSTVWHGAAQHRCFADTGAHPPAQEGQQAREVLAIGVRASAVRRRKLLCEGSREAGGMVGGLEAERAAPSHQRLAAWRAKPLAAPAQAVSQGKVGCGQLVFPDAEQTALALNHLIHLGRSAAQGSEDGRAGRSDHDRVPCGLPCSVCTAASCITAASDCHSSQCKRGWQLRMQPPAPGILTVQHVEEAVGGVVAGIQHALHRVTAGDDDLCSGSGRGSGVALGDFASQPTKVLVVCSWGSPKTLSAEALSTALLRMRRPPGLPCAGCRCAGPGQQ